MVFIDHHKSKTAGLLLLTQYSSTPSLQHSGFRRSVYPGPLGGQPKPGPLDSDLWKRGATGSGGKISNSWPDRPGDRDTGNSLFGDVAFVFQVLILH